MTDQMWYFLQGSGSMLGLFGFILSLIALSAHKRNRLLIRRQADEIHKRQGTKRVQ